MTVSGFLSKTFDIFSDPANEDICGWGANGQTILVKKIDEFSKTILPKYFKHSNFQSFVRQLNMYDFHKTVQDPGNGEFTHVNFRQNRPDLLPLIKRKAHSSKNRANSITTEKVTVDDGVDFSSFGGDYGAKGHSEGDSVFMMAALEKEQQKQKRIREDFEWRLSQLEAQKARITELEAQQGRLAGENYMLKHMLEESRSQQQQLQNKMEGVLKLMYHAFVNSGQSNVATIGNGQGIPESRLLEFCSYLNVPSPSVLKLESGGKQNSPFDKGNVLDSVKEKNFVMDDDTAGHEISSQSSGNDDYLKRKIQVVPTESNDGKTDSSTLEKMVSFDSLAGNIRSASKPPLSNSSNYRPNAEGALLSRQHSLEVPPTGIVKDKSSGAHIDKKQRIEGSDNSQTNNDFAINRQGSNDESLGLPLAHMDSMDSTLATLFDISDADENALD